ncbi:cell surface protein [Acidovorax sp. 106]|uniref:cell surface protein n=1 Tax=Acidovorax sp. 106 TaxID=2135637 RepID=UPI000EAC91DC|nr:cell surface protein [Acidovorax sp. 106]RLJ38469.1 hypothetical protein C8C98_2197 [Acidovorax sp. 106]
MKKNVLALSIAAMIGGLGFAGAASASVVEGTAVLAPNATTGTLTASNATTLELAEGGVGHMLLVPYYTVQNGNMTVLHVVNTDTVNGKAVKVRFRGAANSDDVMDFQVFMSPGDVWTAAVTANATTGIAQVQTSDNTCTVPTLGFNEPQAFSVGRLNPAASDLVKANGTREGYVEIFNMADISGADLYTVGTTTNTKSALYTAVKHVNAVAPCSVAGSTARTTLNTVATTNFTTEPAVSVSGLDTPTGGLMGDWYIINVPETTTFSGAATAVVANGRGNFVHFPQTDGAVTGIDNFTADPLLRTDSVKTDGTAYVTGTITLPALAAGFYDLPDMSTPYLAADWNAGVGLPKNQATALTAALAVSSVTNQYANDTSITAKTDWVFSMPTRRYSVAANYKAITSTAPANDANVAYRLFSNLSTTVLPSVSAATQDEWFFTSNTAVSTDGSGNICVGVDGQTFYDREETTPTAATPGPVFSPRTPGVAAVVSLCGEASVLAFKYTDNSVLASSVARSTVTSGTYTNGWGVLTTKNATGATNRGLPLLGSSFIKLTNPQAAAGLSGTYGITWPHRFTK